MFVSRTRSILKTISWRIVGTLDTIALGWFITGDPTVGLKVGGLELITKFINQFGKLPFANYKL